jgi:stage IV sporulation protein FB
MVMETDSHGLSYGQELAAVLAGPGTNLLCALALTVVGPGLEGAVGAHLMLGGFNLLPVRPLDGGRALFLAAAWLMGPAAGERIARWTGAVTAAAAAMGAAWLIARSGGSLWLLPAAAGLASAAWREFRGDPL